MKNHTFGRRSPVKKHLTLTFMNSCTTRPSRDVPDRTSLQFAATSVQIAATSIQFAATSVQIVVTSVQIAATSVQSRGRWKNRCAIAVGARCKISESELFQLFNLSLTNYPHR
ncbi:hypothetical protein PI95_024505 [Hassallia byssoidea VB512170]|uniref:Uncharacterized protein n=1 Tax=Hassallia byssoidea VB512170 TaxID=1304833 RepID=A0A846HG56_9CYAN|nr:hypothetical protein [Hassalia byssoidea]NEU75634.1 hypothetical protein [Hassalia byssoidea VB512170]